MQASVLASGPRGTLSVPLRRLIEGVSHFRERIGQDDLVRLVNGIDLSARDMADFRIFHHHHYVRNLIHRSPQVEILCMCWQSGQRSPIHDHNQSNCVVRVLEGVMTNTDYQLMPSGFIRPTASHDYGAGASEARSEAEIHQVANLQPEGCNLITLHVYSPPLVRLNVFSAEQRNGGRHFYPVEYWFQGDGI